MVKFSNYAIYPAALLNRHLRMHIPYLRDEFEFGSLPYYRAESIKKDLTPDDGKPLWPLSSYGPAKAEPILIGGLDESPEELRFMAWQAVKSGDPMHLEGYKTYEANKISTALAAHKNGEMNSMDAFKAAFEASRTQSSGFGAFGQPSAPTSAFGQPSSTSIFGQSSSSTPTFGQPSSTSAFGQQSSSASAFGQPKSVFGQPSFGQLSGGLSAFGPGGVGSSKPISAFGQPAFGQPSQPVSPFSKPVGTSAFGQPGFGQQVPAASSTGTGTSMAPPTTTTTSNFGLPTFGQPSTPASSFIRPAMGFGAPVFGQSSQPVFGQPGFGQPNRNQQLQTVTQSASGPGGGGGGFGAFAGKPASFVQSAFAETNLKPSSSFGIGSSMGSEAPTSSQSLGMDDEAAKAVAPPKPTLQPSNFVSSNDPYISMLPENYKEVIPKEALHAFESAEFSWGYVPEWIPPVETR
ncbi:hypothetical protein Clacol_006472 [Clathrus columnatus]|uniref:Uncharacterized protein n=1 Tax=Clathrus columnatus TaxID=1419009 RepID=A0AAV5AIC4_9AGAM|nr:hypothetical protein Clacol_006472 [Clathrus columnatus]